MRPAPRRPGNMATWSVMRAPAESTRYTMGMSRVRASSMIRTIFSTVRAPHDPALTVASLAITATGRPWTSPTPVTTASAGRSPSRAAVSRPSSTKPSASSRSRRSRSRTKSFPCSASFWWYLAAPPARARSVAVATSSCIGRSRSDTAAESSPGSGGQQLAQQARQLVELGRGEPVGEVLPDPAQVGHGRPAQPPVPLLRQDRVHPAAVGLAGVSLDEAVRRQSVHQPADAAATEQHPVGQVAHPERPSGSPREVQQHLVRTQREVLLPAQLLVQGVGDHVVGTKKRLPGAQLPLIKPPRGHAAERTCVLPAHTRTDAAPGG